MINIKKKSKCSGCTACKSICPKHCISMKEDGEGFKYPVVDSRECINCGLCEKVCPSLHPYSPLRPLYVYGARTLDEETLMTSSSGGLFMVIAEKVINLGGVVFGAKFGDNWDVYHSFADTLEGVRAFKGSKYVQSELRNTFKEAESFLKGGRLVFFTGTPCQIAGLKHFLHKEYENLITADVICHGVPSPMVWKNYLKDVIDAACLGKNTVSSSPINLLSEKETINNKNPFNIALVSFRDKRTGWKKFSFALTLSESSTESEKKGITLSSIHLENSYMKVFLHNYCIRPSCYNCFTKTGKSHSDFTLADFWKLDKYFPDDDMGTSLLLINTMKGANFFPFSQVDYKETSYLALLDSNWAWFYSPIKTYKRQQFWYFYKQKGRALETIFSALKPKRIEYVPQTIINLYHRVCIKWNRIKVENLK